MQLRVIIDQQCILIGLSVFVIDRDHIVLVNHLKTLSCANDRRFYTYDCCFISVRRLLSVNIIFVKHKTKMSTLKRYRVVSPVSRFAPESFHPWVVLPWVVSPVSCFAPI